jgi:PAS domain S-box-containing protein
MLSMRRIAPDARRYILAVLAALVALFLRKMLAPLLGASNPYHTVWIAVVFSAWYCGVGPSVVNMLLSLVGVWYLFLPPFHSFALENPKVEISGMVGFTVFSGFIIALGEANRRSTARSEREAAQRKQIEDELRKSQKELEQRVEERTAALERNVAETGEKGTLLDLANDAIFVKSLNGAISYWNQGAERLYGWSKEEAIGRSTHELLRTEFPIPLAEIETRDYWEGELRHTRRDGVQIVVASRWTTLRDDEGKPVAWLELNTDITSRKRAEEAARTLSGQILTLQDEERRRLARELHDSVGQLLASIKMNSAVFQTVPSDSPVAKAARDNAILIDQVTSEIRTMSHLLHPPLLDEVGLSSALRWYVDSFSERSKIAVDVDIAGEIQRLGNDMEIAIFRVVQECLTNVHRHSGSRSASLRLAREDGHVRLEIKDAGKGIPPEKQLALTSSGQLGVGFRGMRERISQLGGVLEIRSNGDGTVVSATLPHNKPAGFPASEVAG